MLRGRTLLFLAEVKGHSRLPEVKVQKPCNRNISSFVMSRGRTLLFLAEVKGHSRSPEVKVQKPCNRDISR
ncbi:hypothetical protein HOLleu_31309 [Holothuria leucospilota]|uniref:Uncharacterized protein n=1 Tax=Holothuria leucospilota TaxID=206669 RepID=A0A9Q0YQ40_HOLLE|nr:hypothetical protein HOLleu_31309 [Holothuria leucospilota]